MTRELTRELVVEADGGSRGNPGPAGYGAVVRDAATGETLTEVAEYVGVATNNVAEYRGLVAGLRAAHALAPQARVRVRMDSKLVIEQMCGRWKIKHPDMRELAAAARAIFPPDAVAYEWIPREQNRHADRLANEAMDAGGRGRQWQPAASAADLETGIGTGFATGADAGLDAGADTGTDGDTETPSEPAVGWGTAGGEATTFVLLRHGDTKLTPQKRFSGSGGTDPELSAGGHRQAEAAAAALAARGTVQEVVTSPLTRCRQTAGAVAARLGLQPRVDEELRETDFGAWEGLTFTEVQQRHPGDLDAWLASEEAAPTGGESFAAVTERVALARDKLLARHPGRTVLLVTHVTPIKVLLRLALNAPPEALFRMELSSAALSEVAYYPDGNASVRLFNDTGHLR